MQEGELLIHGGGGGVRPWLGLYAGEVCTQETYMQGRFVHRRLICRRGLYIGDLYAGEVCT